MRRQFNGAVVFAALMCLYLVPLSRILHAAPNQTPRKPAPNFTRKDSKGIPITLADYKGKVVLLNFWATWCHGCVQEMPWFMEFQDKYRSEGLAVIGVSMDDDGWKSVKPFLQEHKINYRIVVATFESAKQFGVDKGMPVSVLIDRTGKIADLHPGKVDKDAFEGEIQTLLKDTPKNAAR